MRGEWRHWRERQRENHGGGGGGGGHTNTHNTHPASRLGGQGEANRKQLLGPSPSDGGGDRVQSRRAEGGHVFGLRGAQQISVGWGSIGAVAPNDPLNEAGEVDTQLTRVGGDSGHKVRPVGELASREEGATTVKQRVVLGSLEVGGVRRGPGANRRLQMAVCGGGSGVGGLFRPEGVQGLAPRETAVL